MIGEQYVNLIPPNGDGPYLRKGSNIPMANNKIPLPPQACCRAWTRSCTR